MSLNLTSRLKDLIHQMESNPRDSLGIDLYVPYPLLSGTRKYFRERAENIKNGNTIINREIGGNSLELVIRRTLFKLLSIGYTYDMNRELVEDSIKYVIDHLIANYPCHVVWSPINMGVQPPSELIKAIDEQVRLTWIAYSSPWYELTYGIENSLFTWDGHKWKVTSLGEFFTSLSIPSGTVFLLLVEIYFGSSHSNDAFAVNPWHMSREFLEAFNNRKNIHVDIGEVEYSLSAFDPNMDYLSRLSEFQMTQTIDKTEERRPDFDDQTIPVIYIADDYYETELTKNGGEIIKRALQGSNDLLELLVQNLIAFELSGNKYFNLHEVAIKLLERAQRCPSITGDQFSPIKAILDSLSLGNASIVTLRAILPTIERILKNILVEAGLIEKQKHITLGGITSEFRNLISNAHPIIQEDTIQYIHTLDRNSILHGTISPNDEIKDALINLMLNVLLKIYHDYELWKTRV